MYDDCVGYSGTKQIIEKKQCAESYEFPTQKAFEDFLKKKANIKEQTGICACFRT